MSHIHAGADTAVSGVIHVFISYPDAKVVLKLIKNFLRNFMSDVAGMERNIVKKINYDYEIN